MISNHIQTKQIELCDYYSYPDENDEIIFKCNTNYKLSENGDYIFMAKPKLIIELPDYYVSRKQRNLSIIIDDKIDIDLLIIKIYQKSMYIPATYDIKMERIICQLKCIAPIKNLKIQQKLSKKINNSNANIINILVNDNICRINELKGYINYSIHNKESLFLNYG